MIFSPSILRSGESVFYAHISSRNPRLITHSLDSLVEVPLAIEAAEITGECPQAEGEYILLHFFWFPNSHIDHHIDVDLAFPDIIAHTPWQIPTQPYADGLRTCPVTPESPMPCGRGLRRHPSVISSSPFLRSGECVMHISLQVIPGSYCTH